MSMFRVTSFLSIVTSLIWAAPDDYTWSAPSTVYSSSGISATSPIIAIRPSSSSVVLGWLNVVGSTYTVAVNSYNGSSWGTAATLDATTTQPTLQIGTDSSGKGLLVWNYFDGSNLSLRSSRFNGSSWASAATVASLGSTSYTPYHQVAMNLSGNAVCTWRDNSGALNAADFSASSASWINSYSFGSPIVAALAVPALVALDSSNMATIVIFSSLGVDIGTYLAIVPTPLPYFGPSLPIVITATSEPQIAVNPNDGSIAWMGQYANNKNMIGAYILGGQKSWIPISISNKYSLNFNSMSLAISRYDDRLAFAWATYDGLIQASLFNGTSWSDPYTLSTNGATPSIAINPTNKHVVVAWADSTAGGSSNTVKVCEYGTSWGGAVSISAGSSTVASPSLAINDSGAAMIVWSRLVGSDKVLEMATSQ